MPSSLNAGGRWRGYQGDNAYPSGRLIGRCVRLRAYNVGGPLYSPPMTEAGCVQQRPDVLKHTADPNLLGTSKPPVGGACGVNHPLLLDNSEVVMSWTALAERMRTEIAWSETPQGFEYWHNVWRNMRIADGHGTADNYPGVHTNILESGEIRPVVSRSLADTLNTQVLWASTPQGWMYWRNVQDHLLGEPTYDGPSPFADRLPLAPKPPPEVVKFKVTRRKGAVS